MLDKLRTKVDSYFLRKQNVGKGSYIDSSVQVLGWKNTKIGSDSIISEDTWININHRNSKSIDLAIGDHCFIGRRNFFSTGHSIKIGSYCLTGPNCNFLGADHIYQSPFVPYISSGVTTNGDIEVGSNCWLGANVTVLKDVKIGYGSVIGAGTVVNKDVPPLSLVVGSPGKVIKRFDFEKQDWVSSKEFFIEDEKFMTETTYVNLLKKSALDLTGFRIASSKVFGDI